MYVCGKAHSLTHTLIHTPLRKDFWYAKTTLLQRLAQCHTWYGKRQRPQVSLSLSLSLTHTHKHTHTLSVSLSLFTRSPSLPSEEEYVIRPAFTSHVAKSMLSHLDKHQPDVKHGQGAPAAGAEQTFIAPTTGPLSMHEVMRRLW